MAPLNSIFFSALAALAVERVAGHATFQDLWINGVDYGAQCARLPTSNSPVTDVTSNNIRCNANSGPVAKKCAVKGGDTVTIEIHQQPGDRNCASEAIGGAHYGPVQAYLSSVSNSATADGSAGFFKIYADTWAHNTAGASGDDDFWGTKDINTCCGKLNVKIPTDIAPGDYLLRAEALALHTAGSSGGAQFYLTCYQLTIASSGTAKPATVTFPGAYKASDPGILVNIHAKMASYTAPGPAVYAGGSTKVAGSACSGCEKSCTPGGAVGSASSVPQPTSSAGASTPSGGSSSAGSVAAYGQCGGTGWTGATACVSGYKCVAQGSYYSQCTPA